MAIAFLENLDNRIFLLNLISSLFLPLLKTLLFIAFSMQTSIYRPGGFKLPTLPRFAAK
jgi:hypothetical protein